MNETAVAFDAASLISQVLAAHQHGGRVHSKDGWVECRCGERLPCTFDTYGDPEWRDDLAMGVDQAAIIRHQAAILATCATPFAE